MQWASPDAILTFAWFISMSDYLSISVVGPWNGMNDKLIAMLLKPHPFSLGLIALGLFLSLELWAGSTQLFPWI